MHATDMIDASHYNPGGHERYIMLMAASVVWKNVITKKSSKH